MFNAGFFYIFQNLFFLTILFWFLSFLGTKFFKNDGKNKFNDIFECGFINTHKLNISFNINYFLIACLLLLYDIEFFFLLPFLFNFTLLNHLTIVVVNIFILLIVLSFVYDWEVSALDWVV